MNRQCEFGEYVNIMRQHAREELCRPDMKHEYTNLAAERSGLGEDVEDDNEVTLIPLTTVEEIIERAGVVDHQTAVEEYVASEEFVKICRARYTDRLGQSLADKSKFKLVEALEETIDFWQTGRHMFHMPIANTYIPVRNTIMKKPSMRDEDIMGDELGYRYGNPDNKDVTRKRLHPMEQLSPLSGNRMGPADNKVHDLYKNKNYMIHDKPRFYKWRRLSKIKTNSFSTFTRAYSRPMGLGAELDMAPPVKGGAVLDLKSTMDYLRGKK